MSSLSQNNSPISSPSPSSSSCSICFDDLTSDACKSVNRTLPCNHAFHRKCINTWLSRNDTCPLCRYKVSNESRPTRRSNRMEVLTPFIMRRSNIIGADADGSLVIDEWAPPPVRRIFNFVDESLIVDAF